MVPLVARRRLRSRSERRSSRSARAASRPASATFCAASAASIAASACSRVRTSRTAGLAGRIRATTVRPFSTGSPGVPSTRNSRPLTGVETV